VPRGRYAAAGERQLHLRDLVRVIVLHWKAVVAATVLVVLATWSASRRTLPRYQSNAAVQVNSKKNYLSRLDDIRIEELSLRTDPILSEALVLSTQALALSVSDNLGLRLQIDDPEIRRNDVVYDAHVDSLARPDSFLLDIKGPQGFELRDARGRLLSAGPYDSLAVGPGFTFRVQPDEGEPYRLRLSILPRVVAADMVRGGIGFNVEPNTNIVNVYYTGGDPSLVPDILNAALYALRNYGADQIRQVAANRLEFIQGRVDEARQRYLATLSRVQAYQESQNTTDLSAEEVALINTIQDLDREKQRTLLDLQTLESSMRPGSEVTIETLNGLAAVPGISSNPALTFQIQTLLKLYDDRRTLVAEGQRETNPQVASLDARIQTASRALADAATATMRGLRQQIVAVDTNIARLRTRLATYPGKQTAFAQLRLETELQNDTYRYLLSQLEAARISAGTIAPYIEVVESATVASPLGMGTRKKLFLGMLVGLFLGVIAAFFLEYLDQTIKTAQDVERVLEIPVLGLIPIESRAQVLTANGGTGRRRHAIPLVSLVSPDDPSSEAYRALRTNVTFVNAEQRQIQVLCITSPGPGEGKSTTAANLAITLAQQGSRTLLVDADLRRPLVHRAFNLVQEPGLTDVLVGGAQLREAVRPNVIPKLDVLPAGALPPNPSELLGSEAMRRLTEQLRTSYDIIIFDSPPTLAVTDATVLGASADAVILVLRAGETEEVAAQRSLEQLRRVQARVAGTVLNGVEKDRDRYYNYYYYRQNDDSRGRPKGPLAALRRKLLGVG
jgi:capsular exopolysaccharide synthesis family protein